MGSTQNVSLARQKPATKTNLTAMRRFADLQASEKLSRVTKLLPRLTDPAEGFSMIKLVMTELKSAVDGVAPVNLVVLNEIAKGLKSDSVTHRRNASIAFLESLTTGFGQKAAPLSVSTSQYF